jgi:hypothetical protein
MSAILDDIMGKIEYLSAQERDLLIEKLKAEPAPSVPVTVDIEDKDKGEARLRYIEELREKYFLPRPRTQEEYEQKRREMFTPEEIAEFEAFDFDSLPQGKKSLSQMIIEDREDRL